jgi:molecular chaperone DnaK
MDDSATVGIDLGTTFSVIAYINEFGKPQVIPNNEGQLITASAVCFEPDRVIVGQSARNCAAAQPENVVQFIKREMGTEWKQVFNNTPYSPEMISALIIRKLKEDAERYLGHTVSDAVITVPAYFDDTRRRATIQAGEIAGLRVRRVVNEPTAAAVAFGTLHQEQAEGRTLLVYDMGGGTFDVTIMRVENGTLRTLATDGDWALGGKNFDDRLMEYVRTQFEAEHGIDPFEGEHGLDVEADVRIRCEQAKTALSTTTKHTVLCIAEGHTTSVVITREIFEEQILDLLARSFLLTDSCLDAAKLPSEAIDIVLLVGGSTRIPAIRQELEQRFPEKINATVQPDLAVAEGAALVAAMDRIAEAEADANAYATAAEDPTIEKDELPPPPLPLPREYRNLPMLNIVDVVAHSIGVLVRDRAVEKGYRNAHLIPRNTEVPYEHKARYYTSEPGQTGIDINVLQGEDSDPLYCLEIGCASIFDLPPDRPVGRPIDVTIGYTPDAVIRVHAVDVETGRAVNATYSDPYSLSTEQMTKACDIIAAQLL